MVTDLTDGVRKRKKVKFRSLGMWTPGSFSWVFRVCKAIQ